MKTIYRLIFSFSLAVGFGHLGAECDKPFAIAINPRGKARCGLRAHVAK
jgi:hypothetical protein